MVEYELPDNDFTKQYGGLFGEATDLSEKATKSLDNQMGKLDKKGLTGLARKAKSLQRAFLTSF